MQGLTSTSLPWVAEGGGVLIQCEGRDGISRETGELLWRSKSIEVETSRKKLDTWAQGQGEALGDGPVHVEVRPVCLGDAI